MIDGLLIDFNVCDCLWCSFWCCAFTWCFVWLILLGLFN